MFGLHCMVLMWDVQDPLPAGSGNELGPPLQPVSDVCLEMDVFLGFIRKKDDPGPSFDP